MSFAEIMTQGGPIMYILLALSLIAGTIVALKLYHFWYAQLFRGHAVDEAVDAFVEGRLSVREVERLAQSPNPVAKVAATAMACSLQEKMRPADAQAEVDRIGSAEVRGLESWLRGLSVIGHLSPLLGLLGTVMGMIAAFMRLQEVGAQVDASVLSGGIWVALLTTAAGLALAIPVMAIFYLLEGEIDRVRGRMKDVAVRILVRHGKAAPKGLAAETSEEDELAPGRAEEQYGI
jgi:biopolymer transport protein ExbB